MLRATALGGLGLSRACMLPSMAGSLGMRWASKAAASSTNNGRESESKRLGIKKGQFQRVKPGQILVRQRGFSYKKGENVGAGKDHTLFALKSGRVMFTRHPKKTKGQRTWAVINVVEDPEPLASVIAWK